MNWQLRSRHHEHDLMTRIGANRSRHCRPDERLRRNPPFKGWAASISNQNLSCSHTGIRYSRRMIRSFGDKRTETLFWDGVVREFRSIAPRAKRKLEAINAASRLEDLRVPPSNRLEKLKGDLGGFHSIQWRIIFKWQSGEPHAVQIVDYH